MIREGHVDVSGVRGPGTRPKTPHSFLLVHQRWISSLEGGLGGWALFAMLMHTAPSGRKGPRLSS